jgi:cell division transport system permease protein
MIFRITKYSIKNILRNKFLSLSSVLVLTLLMFFINILIILHDVSFKLIESVSSKLSISLYIDSKYDKNSLEVTDLMNSIWSLHDNIQVEYKTKDVILDDLRKREPDLVQILERSNPLPDTIILSNIGIQYYEAVNNLIQPTKYILSTYSDDQTHFSHYWSQYEKIKSILSVLEILTVWLYIIIAVFVLSIFIITYSIIWNFIYYFKDEIYITRLVWGSKKFIYGPFVLQWMIYSFISFVLSFIVFLILLKNVNNAFAEFYTFQASYIILFLEWIIFILVWGVSGLLSSRKYLQNK